MSDNEKQSNFLSFALWKTHLAFWLGAIIVGHATVALIANGTSKLICPESLYQGLSKLYLKQ